MTLYYSTKVISNNSNNNNYRVTIHRISKSDLNKLLPNFSL